MDIEELERLIEDFIINISGLDIVIVENLKEYINKRKSNT